MTTGLEDLGIAGGDFLRDALTNCSDPLQAIEEFQNDNGILLPSLRPSLPFIDLHVIKRVDFHSSVLEEVRENLLQRISNLANSDDQDKMTKLEGLLEKSFPVVKVKTVQPVVMCIMKHIPDIKEQYLTRIVEDKSLYNVSATEVKRQIWQNNQALFGDEVSPLLTQYIQEREAMLFNYDSVTVTFYSPSPKVRRQGDVLQKLVHMIGKNIKLYDMVLQFLRTLFLRTRNVHYCSLRAELLMALHDLEIQEICSADPCHKFTWCIDACIREHIVDAKRSKELQGFLDGIRKGQEFVLGDLSMILCDPYATHTTMVSLSKALNHCALTDTLPRDNGELQLLIRMMSLSLGAWDMIDSQVFKEPKMEHYTLTRYLPLIVSMTIDDQLRSGSIRISEDPSAFFQQPNEVYDIFIRNSALASLIAMYHILSTVKLRDRHGLSLVLPTLIHSENERSYNDTYLHILVIHLIHMGEEFMQEELCITVFDDFLLPAISKENVLCHTMKLLIHIHHHLPPARLQSLLEKLTPNNEHTEPTHEAFKKLMDKISTYHPMTPEEQPPMDDPLMSVPPPSSHID